MKNILIIGATSAIAQATAKQYAKQGNAFFLLARDQNKLTLIANDLKIRGATKVEQHTIDINHIEQHEKLIQLAYESLGTIDIALIAHGTLPNQTECELDAFTTLEALQTNATSTIAFLTALASTMKKQGHGTIATISSVAGDRGRQSNYVYGAAKACINTYLEGLRNRLFKSNVHVLTIKPGFVDTPMTKDFKKGLLWVKPETIAKGIVRAIEKKKNTVYLPIIWYWIMLIIRSIPESVFKRLKL